jgi:SAM-dependent methyltransferase
MNLTPEDILVTIHVDNAGVVGDITMTLAQWIADGPPMRLYRQPTPPRLKGTGQPLPYEAIPLLYQNSSQARDLIAHGLLADSWSANIATWNQRKQELYRTMKAGWYSPENMLDMALGGWVESRGEDLADTPAGKLLQEQFPASGRVLDLNCGYGCSSIALAARGFEVFGVDGSPSLIASAQAAATLSSLALYFQYADPLHLPFPDGWFDAALSLTGYGYLPARSSRLASLEEIYRVLRGDAPLVLSYYVAPEERREGLLEEEQQNQAADKGFSPSTSEEADGSFARWLTAQTFQEELSQSRFQVQSFVVEKLSYSKRETVGAALLKKPVEGAQASHATNEGQ